MAPAYLLQTIQDAAVATGAGTVLNVSDYSVVAVQVTIAGTATITFEACVGGGTMTALPATKQDTGAVATTATTTGIYHINVAALTRFQARISAWSSGAVTAVVSAATESGGALAGAAALPAAALLANGLALVTTPQIGAANLLFNGTTLDLQYANVEGTALTSAARTTTTNSADIITYNARGICIYLDVTVASGTGGLTVNLQHKDPASAKYSTVFAASAAVITAVTRVYLVGQGSSGQGNTAGVAAQCLPRTVRIQITVGDASSYTYTVGYGLNN